MDPRSNGRPPTAAAVPKSAVSAPLHGQGWGGASDWDSAPKLGVPLVLQKGKPVPDPRGSGKWGRERPGFTGRLFRGPEIPHPLPHEGQLSTLTPAPLALQKYIAQVLQDSEVDGDGGPGSSGDEPPSSSSQDEELLMPPDGLTDTDFQSCEDSLIENEIHQ